MVIGYWVLIPKFQFIRRRFLRGKVREQLMGNLPKSRTTPEAPFTQCGIDIFGPFVLKEGRKEIKKYCAACFCSRAIHIETTASKVTDSYKQLSHRFLSRRGPVKCIRSDNGWNFIGTENEHSKEIRSMSLDKLRKFLLNKDCDWISCERNPPYTSHAGGVWQRGHWEMYSMLSYQSTLGDLMTNSCHLHNRTWSYCELSAFDGRKLGWSRLTTNYI